MLLDITEQPPGPPGPNRRVTLDMFKSVDQMHMKIEVKMKIRKKIKMYMKMNTKMKMKFKIKIKIKIFMTQMKV